MQESNNHEEPTEPFAKRRIAICRACENYVALICKQCGCFMPVKTRIKQSECPINKWGKELD